MTPEPLEPLAPELARLFAGERQAPGMPPGLRDQLWKRLAVGLPAAAPVAAHGLRALARRLLAKPWVTAALGLAIGGGSGAVIHAQLSRPGRSAIAAPAGTPPPAPPVPAIAAPPPLPLPKVASPEPREPRHPAALRPAKPPPVAATPAPAAPGPDALARERMLIDTARTALGRGDGKGALALLAQHAREFPRGEMAEEREALRVQGLLSTGAAGEAKSAAAAFHAKYPKSLLFPAIEQSLQGSPPQTP